MRVILALTLIFVACSTAPVRCGYGDFSIGSSHMTNAIPSPFVVRELSGQFVPASADGDPGEWISEETRFRFQMKGPDGTTFSVPVSRDGRFHIPHLTAGRYCFRTSSATFQGYEGTIVIDPRSSVAGLGRIEVALGV